MTFNQGSEGSNPSRHTILYARVVELVDAHDSKSCVERRVGSNPTLGTIGTSIGTITRNNGVSQSLNICSCYRQVEMIYTPVIKGYWQLYLGEQPTLMDIIL